MKNIIDIQKYKDSIENAEIAKSTKLGDKLAFDLMDIEPEGTDNTAILYAAWVTITVQLLLRGFDHSQLKKEITHYNQVARDME